ncbi:MAG: hypothetical protein PVH11_09130 [Anaerolineae bacterium]|jgi:hypothetical protein
MIQQRTPKANWWLVVGMMSLVSLALTGCTLLPGTPILPTPVRPPDLQSTADALRAATEGIYPLNALSIHYEVGNPAGEGRTSLTADGDGQLEVTFERGSQYERWQSKLSEAEFLSLVRLLVEHTVWNVQSQRETGVPDEAYHTLTVEAEGFEPLITGLWAGEVQDHPDFRPIRDVLTGLAREVSGGLAP